LRANACMTTCSQSIWCLSWVDLGQLSLHWWGKTRTKTRETVVWLWRKWPSHEDSLVFPIHCPRNVVSCSGGARHIHLLCSRSYSRKTLLSQKRKETLKWPNISLSRWHKAEC
jgi:hypothetical protein